MKTYTLDEVQDKLIGEIGTPERDRFENDLEIASMPKLDLLEAQADTEEELS